LLAQIIPPFLPPGLVGKGGKVKQIGKEAFFGRYYYVRRKASVPK
jgi:hypothetical protein